jgi:SAM-dependent methyltransferase
MVADCMPGPISIDPFVGETERIRAAYAKRGERPVYSVLEPAQRLALQERENKLLEMFALHGFDSRLCKAKILEVGCGSGIWLRKFVRWGASPQNMIGIDLISDRITEARSVCPPAITLRCQNATDLANLAGDFDLILQSTVFTSILDQQMKRQIATEMLRKLRADGIIVWYDFHVNNPANPDVRGIARSEIRQLFPDCQIHLEKLTLAPPLGRPIARVSHGLYRAVSAIKPLCTHYLGIIRKA